MPRSSIALETTSVVVPAVSETTADCCPVIVLSNDDLPLLTLPKMVICKRSEFGVVVRLIE